MGMILSSLNDRRGTLADIRARVETAKAAAQANPDNPEWALRGLNDRRAYAEIRRFMLGEINGFHRYGYRSDPSPEDRSLPPAWLWQQAPPPLPD
jgi:hypothetical protein